MKNWKYILLAVILFPLVGMVSSCSEESEEEGEFDNWQEKNEAFISQLAANPNYQKILTYTKDVTTTSNVSNSDFIYVEVLESGSGTETALFTDSVLYTYRGRLIPSKSYEKGYVFEETFLGDFDWSTAGMQKACVSWNPVQTSTGTVNSLFTQGFCTALQNMKKGDHWMVYIPYQLAYGETGSSSIPGYSTIIFEVAVADIWHPGEYRPIFK
ncbi:FKBP-type peptidyl-prolyl cis-trans isomerase FklB [Xylanibacter ruminicola]|jgi:FKBP-type peptidyl-prolyl cis-trans isomerase FklB|uniref:Peptidyl-prolyl cis-trans isomerase n=1 Tax=Xylanibacter ruminicola TaxID=839 RepID=A0A1H5X0S2_XYLRU|nr:FKBP-type peptidyl-prolyl cis-trans isomerase [Xylanibacter ruminicola]SEG05153.1 FKBP-type peptidyl-prolyl cis-trans isomerase FklB [Xylanibacter ruminicola]